MPTLQISYKPTENLIPYANNSRTHSDDQINQVASSIKEFGFTNPVLIDEQGGIIAGHGRVMAAKKLGLAEVPTITLEGLTKAQVKAYVIADNQLALNSGWDVDTLKLEIETLQELDFDIDLLGFDDDFLSGLLDEEPSEGLTDDDAVPDLPDDPITVLGDVWQLGSHRLMCGDSTSIDSVEKLMDGHKADMVFTDPPYGMSYGGGRAKGEDQKFKNRSGGIKSHGMILGDDKRGDDLIQLIRDALLSAVTTSKSGSATYVCFPWRTYSEFEAAMQECGLQASACIVWDKKSIGLGNANYRPQHEFIFYCKGGSWFGDKAQSDVWYMSRGATGQYVHPTQKPVELIEKALNNSTKSGDSVLDVFGGSGSTLIAAEKTGRESRLMELDEKYCDVIIKRWQDFTGKEAVLESSGDKFNDMFINGRAGDGADV
jgi:DNA modification methylase